MTKLKVDVSMWHVKQSLTVILSELLLFDIMWCLLVVRTVRQLYRQHVSVHRHLVQNSGWPRQNDVRINSRWHHAS